MNRRGFIGLVTAAAVAPQELIRAPAAAPVLDAAALGSARSAALAASLLQTKEMVTARVLTNKFLTAQEFSALLLPGLNEAFEREYAKTDWKGLYEKTLASEERGRDSTVLPRWEEARPSSEDLAIECRGASRLHNPVDAVESAQANLRKRR